MNRPHGNSTKPRMTSTAIPVRPPWPALISVPLRFIYGLYALLLFLVVAVTSLFAVLLLPTLRMRRGFTRIAARSYFLLAGMPLRLRGTENLPAPSASWSPTTPATSTAW